MQFKLAATFCCVCVYNLNMYVKIMFYKTHGVCYKAFKTLWHTTTYKILNF